MIWEPGQYLKFEGERLRPAVDLLARIPLDAPGSVIDLGCGAGNVTEILRQRWPGAAVSGVDRSPEMLARARARAPDRAWILGDLATWAPDAPVDVLYSNAALHWVDNHSRLFPRLMKQLRSGGVLAAQMPHNHRAPSHTEMVAAARSGPWAAQLEPLLRPAPVADPGVYYDLLRARAREVDVWETEYLHVLSGEDPVVSWVRGTALKPLLDALGEEARAEFLADYGRRVRGAYPRRDDGTTLFPFRRLFIVARAR